MVFIAVDVVVIVPKAGATQWGVPAMPSPFEALAPLPAGASFAPITGRAAGESVT